MFRLTYKLCIVHCIGCSVHCRVGTVHLIVCSVHGRVCSVHCIVCSVHCIVEPKGEGTKSSGDKTIYCHTG